MMNLYTCFGCETETAGVEAYEFWLFFKIDQCSATSFKSSRGELSITDVFMSIGLSWKIIKIRNTPFLVSHPKQ